METWRSETASGIRGAAPAPCGLADVVRSIGRLSGKSVVHELLLLLAAGLAGGHSTVGKKSFPDRSSAIYPGDRKSTRLNSSHVENSYAVFCLKKKKSRRSQPLPDQPGVAGATPAS